MWSAKLEELEGQWARKLEDAQGRWAAERAGAEEAFASGKADLEGKARRRLGEWVAFTGELFAQWTFWGRLC